MTNTTANGAFLIPKWFIGFACLILTGAVPWAYSMSIGMAEVRTKLESIETGQGERIDRNETRIDRLNELHNTRPTK